MSGPAADEPTNSLRDGRLRWWEVALAFMGGTLTGFVVAALLVTPLMLSVMQASGHRWSSQDMATFLSSNPAAVHLLLVGANLGLLGFCWMVARWRFERPLAHFFGPAGWRALLLAMLGGIVLSAVTNGGNEWLSQAGLVDFHTSGSERALSPRGSTALVGSVAVVVLFAPFVEEFFFRGLLLSWLRRNWGAWTGVLVSAALFALAHAAFVTHPDAQGWLSTAELFVAGLALAVCVVRTGSLRTSFALHAAYNATSTFLSVLLP